MVILSTKNRIWFVNPNGSMVSSLVNTSTIDTLQIYFAWDDDLYTFFKERGLGKKGIARKVLPLVYTDNCESTTGVRERRRKYVIPPEDFGESFESLGWRETDKKNEPIISSEKPQIVVTLENDRKDLKFRIIPRVDGKEQYHIEYSSMSAFGSMYNNWAIVVLTPESLQDLLSELKKDLGEESEFVDIPLYEESKQGQRERFLFVKVPVLSYKFSLGEFLHIRQYFELNGIDEALPSLVFKNEVPYTDVMDPVLKIGFVHTTEEQGFESRKLQCAMKLAQHKVTISKRGKQAKVKGRIESNDGEYENSFVVPARDFLISVNSISNLDHSSLSRIVGRARATGKCTKGK